MMKRRFKKGDEVYVRSGDDKGKHGKVLQVVSSTGKVIVEGINIVKRHTRKSQQNQQGGIVEKEAPLPASVLLPYEAAASKGAAK